MGLFTQEPKTDYSVPIELRMMEDASKSQRKFTDTYLDPAIKDNIGYESPRMKMKSITANVDLTDGKAVQKAWLALQAIDPTEATGWLESIKPVLSQQLNSIKIKEADLKFTKTKNKPLVTQRWNLLGRPNFISRYAETALGGLEGQEDLVAALQIAPTEQKEFIINSFLNKIPKENNGVAHKADFKKKLKEANTNFIERRSSDADFGKDLEPEPGTGKRNVTRKGKGTSTPASPYFTSDPEQNQLMQGINANRAKSSLSQKLSEISRSFIGFKPEFLMTDAELELENRRDEVQDWIIDGGAKTHFLNKAPTELAKFKADPVQYYETVIKAPK